MDDLALLNDMADRTPLPADAELAPARERLMSAIDESQKYVTDSARARRRFLGYGTAVVGLAAAITAVFALGGFGVAPPKASAAEKVLQDAAAYARTLPDTPPRPDQFVYIRTEGEGGVFNERWLSADGTRDGFGEGTYGSGVEPACKDGMRQNHLEGDPSRPFSEPCEPEPAYDPAMPVDAAGMRTYLAEVHSATTDNLNDFAKTVWLLLETRYVPPQSLAAIFELLAQNDGLTVEEGASDSLGRRGTGVTWHTDGKPTTIVFDTRTHQLLGSTEWTSVVATGVVDEVGQRP